MIPNATRGGAHRGSPIPPHSAFIHTKSNQVQIGDWQPSFAAQDNLVFLLQGDTITFDPPPAGGSIDVSALPHVRRRENKEPICPAADELRPGFLDDPNPLNVLGLVHLPTDAPVSTSSNGLGAMFATLHMPDGPVTITATPFGGGPARSLRITDATGHVFIANVTMMDYLMGVPANEDDHQYLVCGMFKPRVKTTTHPGTPLSDLSDAPSAMVAAELSEGEPIAIDHSVFAGVGVAPAKPMEDFLCTFAAGCSDSQWP